MPTRILLLHPTTKEQLEGKDGATVRKGGSRMGLFESAMQNHAAKVTRADTEVTQRFLNSYSGSLQNLYLSSVNNVTVVNEIIAAEREGFDAVVIGNHVDSGVQMARAVVNIPVIGPCEASMATGSFIGEKFVMLTLRKQFLRTLEYNIRLFGFEDRFIKTKPVRWPVQALWTHIMDAHQGKPEMLLELFEKTALECIDDGADTILVPGYPFGAALSMVGYTHVADTGVAVVDGAAAALKMAEALADLHRSIGLSRTRSQTSRYQAFPEGLMPQTRSGGDGRKTQPGGRR
jgi:allantoin racemase